VVLVRTEWIDAISKVSKGLKGQEKPPADNSEKVLPKEGATVAKQGIKVSFFCC